MEVLLAGFYSYLSGREDFSPRFPGKLSWRGHHLYSGFRNRKDHPGPALAEVSGGGYSKRRQSHSGLP